MLYSWQPEKRANKALILHHIAKAIERKKWCNEQTPKTLAKHCTYSVNEWQKDKDKSVKRLARESLEYHRLRAFLGLRGENEGGSYCPKGWPWDRPAHEEWMKLTNAKEA